jgi:23S rRNA (cytidine1920-2'-O)/16S rRNA (cytidine1409-2'-O)-methyltransferase
MSPDADCPYVSRAGLKIQAALERFEVSPAGMVCADLGANVGGFADCLLMRGAKHVYTVETGYGILAWKLRNKEPRVTMLERTNALYYDPWASLTGFEGCDLVVIDLGWTRQKLAIPAALKWLRRDRSPDRPGLIITLVKPHYEADANALARGKKAILQDDDAQAICDRVLEAMPTLGVRVVGHMLSPLRGSKGRGTNTGNQEYLALLASDSIV